VVVGGDLVQVVARAVRRAAKRVTAHHLEIRCAMHEELFLERRDGPLVAEGIEDVVGIDNAYLHLHL